MESVYAEDGIHFMENGTEKAAFLEKMEDQGILISLRGAVSGEMANALMDEMSALIVSGQGITVVLEETTYLSPSIMEVFLRMENKLEEKGKYLRIIRMPQSIYNEFKARGMHELLEIEVMKA